MLTATPIEEPRTGAMSTMTHPANGAEALGKAPGSYALES
jgi:hypothetical protein